MMAVRSQFNVTNIYDYLNENIFGDLDHCV